MTSFLFQFWLLGYMNINLQVMTAWKYFVALLLISSHLCCTVFWIIPPCSFLRSSEMYNWQYWLQDWVDYQLNWNASEYGGIDSIRIHPKLVWTPDLLMYNRFEHPQFIQLLIHIIHIKNIEIFLIFPLFFWREGGEHKVIQNPFFIFRRYSP